MASVAKIDRGLVCLHLADSFERLLKNRDDLQGFIKFLDQLGKVVVFGGFVRDAIHNCLHRNTQTFRDLDLIVVGQLEGPGNNPRNHFGGYRKWFTDGLKVDYWTLESTYAFSKGLYKPSLENLLLTTVYTINACAFDPSERWLYEYQAIDAIAARRISFNCKGYLNVFPEFQAFRAIDYAERLDYSLDPEVSDFVCSTLTRTSLQVFIDSVLEHRPELSASHLKEIYETYRDLRRV